MTDLEFVEWWIYKHDVINHRIPINQPITEPELYYSRLTVAEQQNYDQAARAYFADNLDMRKKNTRQLRDLYYWISK